MVFQRFNLFPAHDRAENVMEARSTCSTSPRKPPVTAVAELQRVGLGDRMDYYPLPACQMGGQQQRVAIARVFST